jgi:hypothetical protein
MMCLFADLSLYRGTRRQPLHRTSKVPTNIKPTSQFHTHLVARPWPTPIPARVLEHLRSLSRLPQQPHGRDPVAALPTSRYAHLQGFKI